MAELTQVPICNREFDNYEDQHFPTEWANSVPSKKDATKTLVPKESRYFEWNDGRTHTSFAFFAVVPAFSLPAFVRQNFPSPFCVFPFLTLVVTCGKIDLLLEAAFFFCLATTDERHLGRRMQTSRWQYVRDICYKENFYRKFLYANTDQTNSPPLHSRKILETSSWKCLYFRRWKGKGGTFSLHWRTDQFLLLLLFCLWTAAPFTLPGPDPSLCTRGAFFPCTQAMQGFYATSLSERDKGRWTLVRPKERKEGQEMFPWRGINTIRLM